MQDSLRAWANNANVRWFIHDGDHEKDWQCPLRRVSQGVVFGHRGFGFCGGFAKRKALYMVALRDPVSRFVSEFDYFLSHNYPKFRAYHEAWGERDLNDLIKEYNVTLSRALPDDHPDMRWPNAFKGLSNQQSAFMCGFDCVRFNQTLTYDEKLRRAMANLERTDVVAVMEKLDDFILQAKMHTTWIPKRVKSFPRENKRKSKKSEIDAEAEAILLEWGRNDVVLYARAVQLANEKTAMAKSCIIDNDHFNS